jgi:hypothetical protein
MTLGELSREEPSAGCSGRAEKPNKGMPLGSLGSRSALHFLEIPPQKVICAWPVTAMFYLFGRASAPVDTRKSFAHAHAGRCGVWSGAFSPVGCATRTHQRNQDFTVPTANGVRTGNETQ